MKSIWQLPERPEVDALYVGCHEGRRLLFVGIAESLFERILEQFVVANLAPRAASSILFREPGYVSEIQWWEDHALTSSNSLRAAELVASETLAPLLTSRRPPRHEPKPFTTRPRFA